MVQILSERKLIPRDMRSNKVTSQGGLCRRWVGFGWDLSVSHNSYENCLCGGRTWLCVRAPTPLGCVALGKPPFLYELWSPSREVEAIQFHHPLTTLLIITTRKTGYKSEILKSFPADSLHEPGQFIQLEVPVDLGWQPWKDHNINSKNNSR